MKIQLRMFRALVVSSCAALLLSVPVRSDEGMWTFDNPPLKQLQEKYHFTPTQQWLDHIRLSCVRLNDGGSGSFVSAHGLLLTNHHVARGQLQKNSTAQHDYIKDGFYAATPEQEMKSPDLEVNVLVSFENVSERVAAAVKKAARPNEEFAARRAVIADIERESQQKTGLRSDVVTLYNGGEYWLYRYQKYTDVRLVFAPEQQIAFFGGDPDNFTYPRYDLDMALFRVYQDGKPIETKDYLTWNPAGAADNDLVFVAGHPGSTARLDTVAQLQAIRDVSMPLTIKSLKNRIAALEHYASLGTEEARQISAGYFSLTNSLKANEGRLSGLLDPRVMAAKQKDEADFRGKVMANPQWKAAYGTAWDIIAGVEAASTERTRQRILRVLDSQYATLAMNVVQYVAEIQKPDGERLATFHDSQLESTRLRLFSPAPIYPAMEIAKLTASIELMQAELGPNDAFVKAVLDGRSPSRAAADLVKGTTLADPAIRHKLVEGGEAALAASTDPMIVLARKLDPIRRELTSWLEDHVTSAEQRAGEQLGKARFAVYGKGTYPDATFTLRLSYGQVQGFPMNGTKAPAKTTLFGLYDRAAGFNYEGPFYLPSRYQEGRDKLNMATPLNFVTTNDIIGGNSGSPVINAKGEIVGLIFDGNIESLVGDFVYDGAANRSVAVHTAAMTETLTKLYNAKNLVNELTGK
jgi:Peptidase S46